MAEARYRDRLNIPGLLGPSKEQIDDDLKNTNTYVNGIGLLMEKYNQKGYSDALAKLKDEMTEYDAFVRREVLPKARTDFRLPPDIYRRPPRPRAAVRFDGGARRLARSRALRLQ